MPQSGSDEILDYLVTVRDWRRYGVSIFNKADLVYGHGTDNAADEAAFIILSVLELPIDSLDPWLDCSLTRHERVAVADLFHRRVQSRQPASYLTKTAWIQDYRFYVDERVIVPRSFIGELLWQDSLAAAIADPPGVERALDLCTGSGCLAILAAYSFPFAQIDASDISPDAIAVARQNIQDYELEDRVALLQSDLFADVPPKQYDVIIANPPYVTTEAVASFPPEYKAEPEIAHAGGKDGLDLVHRILEAAPKYLSESGVLIVEIGQARAILEAAYPDLPFLWLDTEMSEGEVFALQASDFAHSGKTKLGRKGE